MRRTNVYLDDSQLELLRRLAEQRGAPMSTLIREAIDAWLNAQGVRSIGPDEWERRFDALMGRRRVVANRQGFDAETVDADVLREIKKVRRSRAARSR